ncbi:MAG TPA: hypothetical protein VGQ83_01750, partial [Polyangia bacterium]
NFIGDLADAFACYASVGVNGCGFEQPLASVRVALDRCETAAGCTQSANRTFFRPDAYLAVVFITDEDDCSAPVNSQLFDPTQTQLSSTLGPLTSYRCFEFGNLCDGLDPGRQQGPRFDCAPGNKDATNWLHQLTPVEDFAHFLKALKAADPRMVYVSVIAGPPGPVSVGLDAQGYPDLQPSCNGALGSADPGLRWSRFIGQFDADRASFASICDNDLSNALAGTGLHLAQMVGRHCLGGLPADSCATTAAVEPACTVKARALVDAATGTYQTRDIPGCALATCDPATAPGGDCRCVRHWGADTDNPCWYAWDAAAACVAPSAASRAALEIKVDWGTDTACVTPEPPAGTELVVDCSWCRADPAQNVYDCSPGCAGYWPRCCPTPTPGCAP